MNFVDNEITKKNVCIQVVKTVVEVYDYILENQVDSKNIMIFDPNELILTRNIK